MAELVILPFSTGAETAVLMRGLTEWVAWKLRFKGLHVATPLLLRELPAQSDETGGRDFIVPTRKPDHREAAEMITSTFPARHVLTGEMINGTEDFVSMELYDQKGVLLGAWKFSIIGEYLLAGLSSVVGDLESVITRSVKSYPEDPHGDWKTRFTTKSPEAARALLILLEIALRVRNRIVLNDPEDAVNTALRAFRLDPECPDIQRVAGDIGRSMIYSPSHILQNHGRTILSTIARKLSHPAPLLIISAAEGARGRDESALDAVRAALALAPASIEALDQLVKMLLKRGESTDAVSALIDAVGTTMDDGWVLNRAGTILATERRYAEAEKILKQAVSLLHPNAFANLARIYAEQDRKDEALDILKQGLELRGDGPARSILYVLHDMALYHDLALSALRDQARLNEEFSLTRALLAQALVGHNISDEAVEWATSVVGDAEPDGEACEIARLIIACDGDKELIHLVRQVIQDYREKGELPPDDLNWEQMAALMPGYWMPFFVGGLQALNRNKPEEGLEHFRIALKDAPGNGLIHMAQGEALLMSDNYQEAEKSFRVALGNLGINCVIMTGLAESLLEQGSRQEAASVLEVALKRWDTPKLRWLKKRLKTAQ